MKLDKKRDILTLSIITSPVLIFLLWGLLSIPFKFLRFDFIKGGDGQISFSESKSESKERGVYVCDVRIVSGNTQIIKNCNMCCIKEAWIEKLWQRREWYWTTVIKEEGYFSKPYSLIINFDNNYTFECPYHLWLKLDENRYFNDFTNHGQYCLDFLTFLPDNDTLEYCILSKEVVYFNDSLQIGKLQFVLEH